MESICNIDGGMSASNLEAMRAKGFQRADKNSDGGIDKEEMQGVLDKFTQSEESSSVSAENLFSEYDEDEDGVLNEDEMADAMDSIREKMTAQGKGPGKGGQPSMEEAAGSYAVNSGESMTDTLMDLLADSDDEEEDEENNILQQLLDQQQRGTLSGYSAVDLLA